MHTAAASLLSIPHELASEQFSLVLRKLADDLTYGSDPSRFVGSGIDYAQSRPFSFGDSVRSIDWRVTARTGKVYVKEYEATKRVPMYLLVDTSASMGVSSQPLSKHDVAVWIAGVLALVGLRRRSPVAMLSCGERAGRVTPSLSRGQVWRWIEDLRMPSTHEQTRLAQQVEKVEMLARHTSAVIVISDLHDPAAGPAIRRIAQRHDCIVLQLQDPAETGRLRSGFFRGREAESERGFFGTGRARWFGEDAEHAIRDLIDAGVDHSLIRTDQPIIAPLRRMLSSRGGAGRNAR